jgi:hypothetical protein
MNFDRVYSVALTLVVTMAAVGPLDRLQIWIWKAQARVLYESRSWGSPRFFPGADQRAVRTTARKEAFQGNCRRQLP